MMKTKDDLEAVRILTETLEPFEKKDRERIVRWALEKLGTPVSTLKEISPPLPSSPPPSDNSQETPIQPERGKTDIKSFVNSKNPGSAVQLAAVVAYYYHFEAPPELRKESINKEDLVVATREAGRRRQQRPEQVLVNAYHAGFLERTGESGQYKLNPVGENLVAMTLPETKGDGAKKSTKKLSGAAKKRVSRKRRALTKKTAKNSRKRRSK